MKYILVTGGVISGVGKGIISSSIGVLLKNNGYKVSVIKIDPYLNIDAGTFSPYEHGEVFVLDDGAEVDLDLGNYERFLSVRLTRDNNITTGKMFQHVTERERRGDYCGQTVQLIPHFTDAVIQWIERVARIPVDGTIECPDVCIIELGGTVGDIEGMTYLAAFERFQRPALKDCMMNVHVSLVVHPYATGEPKTKPMQNSVSFLELRAGYPFNFKLIFVVGIHDVSNIYKVPLLLQEQHVLDIIIHRLHLKPINKVVQRNLKFNMCHWRQLSELCDSFNEEVVIALVGKYVKIDDAYASVNKALKHAAIHSKRALVDAELLESGKPLELKARCDSAWEIVRSSHGIIVPGGFDKRGVEGMIKTCQYARENGVPFLGVCLGMQCAAIEVARNILGISNANSTEFNKDLHENEQIIIDMPEHNVESRGLGGTMRLGRRTSVFLTEQCKLRRLYGKDEIEERHRHRYEVNPRLVPDLSSKGLLFVGMGVDETTCTTLTNHCRTQSSAALMKMAKDYRTNEDLLSTITDLCHQGGDGVIRPAVRMEICEMKGHPYFVGTQFHPEYLSHPLQPSPPFLGLLLAASGQLDVSYLQGVRTPSPMFSLMEQCST
uniref:CTP synthase n=1 Tax=Angiostrongylus cantonensis TaxID=6313 RepID=A0A158P5V0_ANGCA